MTRITATLTIALACASGQAASGQAVNDVRKLYDSGQYQKVITAAGPEAEPRVTFLRAQSHQKLSQANEAREAYTQLAGRPESDAWSDSPVLSTPQEYPAFVDHNGTWKAAPCSGSLNNPVTTVRYLTGPCASGACTTTCRCTSISQTLRANRCPRISRSKGASHHTGRWISSRSISAARK